MRKINSFIALIIVSNILFLSGCQTGQIKAPEILAEFDIQGGVRHIILPVTFQGKEYPFVLDTAGMRTVFDDSFKDKLGKRFLWPNKGRGPEGKEFLVEYYRGHDYFLGPLDLEDTTLLRVIDLDQLAPGKNRKFQGIIGLDFLKKYVVQIDFDQGKVTFFKGKKEFDLFSLFKSKENKHLEWGEPISMKAKFLSGLRYIKGELSNDKKVDFLVDTGWLSPNSLKSNIFDKTYPSNISNVKGTDTEYFETKPSGYNMVNVIENFSVGSFEYEDNIFRRSNESVLGLMYLYRHVVTIDFPNNVIYLKKGKNFDKQLNVQFSLIAGCLLSSKTYVVSQVDPNGPAYQKGVRKNDILLKVNDREISSLGVAEFWNFTTQLSAPEDGKVHFTFKRGEEIFTVVFTKQETSANKD